MERNIGELVGMMIVLFLMSIVFLAWLTMKIFTTIASWRSMRAFEKIANSLSETVKVREKEPVQVKPVEPPPIVDVSKDVQPEQKIS